MNVIVNFHSKALTLKNKVRTIDMKYHDSVSDHEFNIEDEII